MHQLPGLDDASRAKVTKLLGAGELVPVMNHTKWGELINSMLNSPEMEPKFRLRSVLAPPGHVLEWDADWHFHIHPVAEIEWLELNALSSVWLETTLRKCRIRYSIEEGTLRVWGYMKHDSQPDWR
ncbi:DUF6678 family protein [Pseudomonas syringae]|uniref:DUF6678 family protein n=1 Tax=Pseudomonas syringae TaxID=317 RepID=UPI003F7A0BD8